MRNFVAILSCLLLLAGCYKLEFDGNAFYTVKGRITDTANHSIANLQVLIYNTRTYSPFLDNGVVSAKTNTDIDGNFTLTFPASNGFTYLQLQEDYVILPNRTGSNQFNNGNTVFIDTSSFHYYFTNLKTIKVYKP